MGLATWGHERGRPRPDIELKLDCDQVVGGAKQARAARIVPSHGVQLALYAALQPCCSGHGLQICDPIEERDRLCLEVVGGGSPAEEAGRRESAMYISPELVASVSLCRFSRVEKNPCVARARCVKHPAASHSSTTLALSLLPHLLRGRAALRAD